MASIIRDYEQSSMSLNVDARVSARYMATKYPAWQCMWYLGRIVVVHEDDTYDIEYDDGDSEQRVARKNIKRVMLREPRRGWRRALRLQKVRGTSI